MFVYLSIAGEEIRIIIYSFRGAKCLPGRYRTATSVLPFLSFRLRRVTRICDASGTRVFFSVVRKNVRNESRPTYNTCVLVVGTGTFVFEGVDFFNFFGGWVGWGGVKSPLNVFTNGGGGVGGWKKSSAFLEIPARLHPSPLPRFGAYVLRLWQVVGGTTAPICATKRPGVAGRLACNRCTR